MEGRGGGGWRGRGRGGWKVEVGVDGGKVRSVL